MDRHFDVALLVPLEEEFDYLTEILPVRQSFSVLGDYYYEIDIDNGGRTVVAHIIGDMGQGHATLAAERMAERFSPDAVVLIGLAGSLKRDLLLGDVVIATHVDAYLQAARAVPGRDKGDAFEFELAGEVWRTPFSVLQFTRNFRHMPELHSLYSAWRSDAAARRKKIDALVGTSLVRTEPALAHGPLASGDVVAAAQEFTRWLHRRDRKLAAVEMEAGGVANATQSRAVPLDLLVIRGISDFADERKSELDALEGGTNESGVWRRYAVHNAAGLVQAFLRSGHFPPPDEIEVQPRKAGRAKGQLSAEAPVMASANSPFVGQGHKRALADLLTWLDQPDPIRLVQGFSGVGKSRLARELAAKAPRGWQTVWVDDTPADGVHPLLLDIAGAIDRQGLVRVLPGGDLTLVLEQALAGRVILVLDEFQKALPSPNTDGDPAGIAQLIHQISRRRGNGKLLLLSNQSYPDWLSGYPLQTLSPLNGAEGTAFLKRLLAARGCVDEAGDARLEEVVGYLGGNPRALEVLSAFLVSDPLDSLVGPLPRAWEVADRQVDPQFVERLEERIVRRVVSRVSDDSRELLRMLAVYRRPVGLDAIASLPISATAAALARRELIASFLMEQRRSGWYALHPIAHRIALEHLSQDPKALRTVHALAANHYARHFRAKQVRVGQHGRNFLDARYHMMKSGNQSELVAITSRYVLYLERAYARASVPLDPEALDERIAVLIAAAQETSLSPELSHHLARLLFARAQEGDTELALEYIEEAAQYLDGHEACSLVLRLYERVGRYDAIAPTVRRAFARVQSPEARLHLYHLALDLTTKHEGMDAACDLAQEFIEQLEVGSSLPTAYFRLSQDLVRSGRLTEAVAVAQQAVVRLGIKYGSEVHTNAIELLLRAGDLSTAARVWDEAVRTFPTPVDDNLMFVRLEILERAGQVEDAIALASERLAAQDSNWLDTRWLQRLVQLLLGQGDVPGVVALVLQAFERYDEAPIRVAVGRRVMAHLVAAGAEDGALAAGHLLLEVVEPHKALVEVYRALMNLYIGRGNRAQAIVLGYESLPCLSPDHNEVGIYSETMQLLVEVGCLDDAIALGEMTARILSSSPFVGPIYHRTMSLLAIKGDVASARDLGWRATSMPLEARGKRSVYHGLLYLFAHEGNMSAMQECNERAFAALPPGYETVAWCRAFVQAVACKRGRRAGLESLLDCCRRLPPDDAAKLLPRAFNMAAILGEWDIIDHIDEIVPDEVRSKQIKAIAAVIQATSTGDYVRAANLASEPTADGQLGRIMALQQVFALCCCSQSERAAQLFVSFDSSGAKVGGFMRPVLWLGAFAHTLAGAHEVAQRYMRKYLNRALTPDEAANGELVFDLWCATAGIAGSTPANFYPRLPRTATGLAHDLVVPADSPILLDWPYPVVGLKRADLVQ